MNPQAPILGFGGSITDPYTQALLQWQQQQASQTPQAPGGVPPIGMTQMQGVSPYMDYQAAARLAQRNQQDMRQFGVGQGANPWGANTLGLGGSGFGGTNNGQF